VTPAAPIVAPTPAAAADNPPGQRLVVRAVEPTWIRVQADGGRIVEELLPLGATREWTAERRFLLTVGNAGGIEIELNGRPMPRLGERGAVIRQLELPKTAAAGS
jgi:cytoskeleton protein RodZ